MTVFKKIFDILGGVLNAICGALVVVITLAMFTQVILRYVTQRSSGIVEEGLPMFMIWLGMLICGLIYFKGQHINTDLIFMMLKGKKLIALKILISLIVVTFAVIFGLAGWQQTQVMIALGQRSGTTLSYPLWIREISLVFGMALLVVYGLIDLGRNVNDLFSNKPPEVIEQKVM